MKEMFKQIAAEIENEMKKAERKFEFADKESDIAAKAIKDTVAIAREYGEKPSKALKALAYTILDAIIDTDMDEFDPETGKMKWR